MTLVLTPAGLQTQTQQEIVDELAAKVHATFGNNVNTSISSIMGQLINIFAELRALDQQYLLAVYQSFDPNSAAGVALDRLAALTGSVRKGETKSVVNVVFEFNAAGIVNNGDLFQNDDTGTQWQVINGPYTDTGGPYPEQVNGQLEAVDAGPVIANAGTNWSLVTANPSLNGVTNPTDDAALGRFQESDPDFRIRRQVELFSQNIGGLAAIRAVVSRVEGVETVQVYHNPATQPADADGIPFKAFNVVVETSPSPPPLDLQQSIADAIWSAMGAGGEAYGTDFNLVVTDSEGVAQPDIRFDLVTQVPIYVNVALVTTGTEQPISQNLAQVVQDEILKVAQRDFDAIGRNQLAFEYEAIIANLQASGQISGVVQTTVLLSRVSLAGPYADPVDIAIRERPTFDSINILATVI